VNVAQAIAHLESRFGPPEETGIEPQDVEDFINTALLRTTEYEAEGINAADFQRTDDLPLEGDGSATIPADFLPGYISRINHSSSLFDFVVLANRGEFVFQFCSEFGFASIEDGKVHTKAPAGTDDPLTGNLAVQGIAIPTLGALLTKFEPHFLDLLTEITAERKKLNPIGRDRPKEMKAS
jgi:hypothetical protein